MVSTAVSTSPLVPQLCLFSKLFGNLAVPLLVGQGCIAGPRHNWVGIYWVAPTLLYTASVSIFGATQPVHINVTKKSIVVRARCQPFIPVTPTEAAHPLEAHAP